MYEATDVKRSIKRYLSLLLDDPWTIRTERREVRDEERPVAVIDIGAEVVLRAREAITQGNVEYLYPVTLNAYPALPTAEGELADEIREASHDAELLQSLISRWLAVGLTVKDTNGRHFAGPSRIPLWDYAGVPLTGPDRAGPVDPHDVLWVGSAASGTASARSYARSTIGVEAIQDSEDLRRFSIISDFRVSMEAPGRVRDDDEGYVAEKLSGSFKPVSG